MKRRGTGLDPHDAGGQLLKEWQDMPALQSTVDDHFSHRIDAVDLKCRFRDIETYCRDHLHPWLPSPKNRDRPSGNHFNGTYVPVEEPSTASGAEALTVE